jgi:SAM-dependent methyltransferase
LPLEAAYILDIGCGDGYLSCQVARRLPLANVIGIDADSHGVKFASAKAAENRLANIQFMVSSSDNLPFSPRDFDLVIMTDVIEHLQRPGNMLAEIRRVLKPLGIAIVTTPNRQPGFKWDERHFHEYTSLEFKAELAAYFSSIEVFGSWPIKIVQDWKAKRFRRAYLDLAARLGFNHFDTETRDPSSDYGQLMAVCCDKVVSSSPTELRGQTASSSRCRLTPSVTKNSALAPGREQLHTTSSPNRIPLK